jgi:hypothetical protein
MGGALLAGRLPLESVQLLTMPGPDYATLELEDVVRAAEDAPVRIAVPNTVNLNPQTSGTWEYLDDGRMMWRLRVLSPGAAHLNFGFDRLALPSSASMTIASLDGSDVTDTLTAQTPLAEGQFWSRIVLGEEVVISFVVDANQRAELEAGVSLSAINEGYRGFRGATDPPFHTSGSCNIDVACAQGDDWSCEIAAVGVFTINGAWTCSGAMVNNTSQDGTPYFLTAAHCGVNAGNDQSVVVYWNYENSTCRTPDSTESGQAGDGGLAQTSSGVIFRTDAESTDYALLELTSSPPTEYGVSYAGWSRSTSLPSIGAGIHHPNAAEKRISIPATVVHDPDPAFTETYWEVLWADGVTEQRSSGSPLFNGEHQIIGQLCCGDSGCSSPALADFYGKSLAASWPELSPFLDPTSTGAMTIDTLCNTTTPCQWALAGGTSVGSADLLLLLNDWGAADSNADFDGSGTVDIGDLLELFEHWGECTLP